ncbi:MAG TPA: hypothetical protein VLI41_11945 [Phenylobacterium sp.]|uniref:hypothetical protein n=1 Tax=Phenylobacterium sp. TaxID=1871053 RepID=UPI002CE59479|nr:hypothetical protein [Phenylobacterium sp.]HSV03904.1 hypothetical protein [Phenylobacterium sp.]
MIIHLSPDAPLALQALAASALVAHIGGGTVGLAAGALAVAARKGGRLHRAAGDIFVAAMLIACLVGAAASPFVHRPANLFGGVFAAYLVATGWLTMRRPPNVVATAEIGAFLAIATAASAVAVFAWFGARSPHGVDGVPWPVAAVLALVGALAAGLDLKVILAGGVSGQARLARHLWRMCLAFSFGTASLFIGQPNVFPAALRGSPLLILLGVAPLLVMTFWLYRVRRRGGPAAARPPLAPGLPMAG